MLRIYYTSESGKKVRSISKNLGNIQQTHMHIAIKILRQLGYTNIVESKDPKCDLNAKLEYELYDIDIKVNNRISLIDTFAFIYLWQLYQKAK
jgi:signal recognition particle subunit SEC65